MEPCKVETYRQARLGNAADEQNQQLGEQLPSTSLAPVNQAVSPATFPTTNIGAISAMPAKSKGPEPQAMVVSLPGQKTGPVKGKATRKKQRKTLALLALKPAPLMPLWIQRPLQPGWISALTLPRASHITSTPSLRGANGSPPSCLSSLCHPPG